MAPLSFFGLPVDHGGEEAAMVHPGAYRGNKRQKELKRLQKQQEKREKRLQKKIGQAEEGEERVEGQEVPAPEGAAGENPA